LCSLLKFFFLSLFSFNFIPFVVVGVDVIFSMFFGNTETCCGMHNFSRFHTRHSTPDLRRSTLTLSEIVSPIDITPRLCALGFFRTAEATPLVIVSEIVSICITLNGTRRLFLTNTITLIEVVCRFAVLVLATLLPFFFNQLDFFLTDTLARKVRMKVLTFGTPNQAHRSELAATRIIPPGFIRCTGMPSVARLTTSHYSIDYGLINTFAAVVWM
jgi:hypothetical protein